MMGAFVKTVFLVVGLGGLAAMRVEYPPAATPLKLEYPANFGNRISIPADNPTTKEGVELGRMLFYETKLSADNSISCNTCHNQALAFTDGRRVSQGVDGEFTERNSMSLANLLWVRNFFWDGRANGLEKQAEGPLTDLHEMGQSLKQSAKKLQATKGYPPLFQKAFGNATIDSARIVKALSQFERTLISANSTYDRYLRGEYQPNASEQNGIALFFGNPDRSRNIRGAACGHCHGGPKTFNELYHNNGLDSIAKDDGRAKFTGLDIDKGRFRVVTLRNIALTAPYMHDGRFNTLEEVVDHYSDHIKQGPTLSVFLQNNSNGTGLALTAQEKKDLISFMRMLTDSTFITDKRFSNPFAKR